MNDGRRSLFFHISVTTTEPDDGGTRDFRVCNIFSLHTEKLYFHVFVSVLMLCDGKSKTMCSLVQTTLKH